MEFVIGIGVNLVTEVAKHTIVPINNQIKYLCKGTNRGIPANHADVAAGITSLKDQVERLKDAKERVGHSVDAAKRNGEEIEQDIDKWLTTVNEKLNEDVEKVMQEEEKAKKKCFLGLCPSFWTRYKFSMKAEKESKYVAALLEQGKFDKVSHRPSLQPRFVTDSSVKDFEAFESRRVVLNGIMEALKDDSIKVIGAYGMGGVGKTTLVKEVARQVKGQFDSVVIATVTQTLDVMNIQNQIADFLGLKFDEQSIDGRGARLRQRLMTEKKILVVLDDIWARLDLEEVGIPFGNENEGCKILLTSRDYNVLSSGMDTHKNFAIGILKEKEAWDLFKKKAGDSVESFDLQPKAMEVAKRCGGLPIAISTVARALKNKRSLFEWENALHALKTPSSGNFTETTAEAYKAIESSYNYLEDDEVKRTFLLCSLIGHDGLIEMLLKYSFGLGYFEGVYTINEARGKVLAVVSKLKDSCLLLDSNKSEKFDIHDVVRAVALSIASRDHQFVLRDGDVIEEWPEKERVENSCAIKLCFSRIETELPDKMECSSLSLFCMSHMGRHGSVKIPANFFRGTERIKVLDFNRMHFPSLPVSMNLLTDLRTLCLDSCALEDISIIEKLKSLKILSFINSDIKELPTEIAQLTQLRLLDLSACTRLEIIPPNVLSKLSKLEELYMGESFVQWEEEVPGAESRNASLEELMHLTHLTTLYANIPNAHIIPEGLFVATLDRYRISIGNRGRWNWIPKYEYSRTLILNLQTSIYLDQGVKILLKKTEDLYLDELRGIKNVFDELGNGENLPHLKKLHIQYDLDVQHITLEKIEFSQLKSMTLHDLPQLLSFSSERRQQGNACTKPLFNNQILFPQLETLVLSSINIQRIWHNQLLEACHSFSNLKSLIIQGCGDLEHLLSPSVARGLVQLQHVNVEDCQCLREIIFTEEREEGKKDVICFPQLNKLEIRYLQNLFKFCSGNYEIEFPSLKELNIEDCPKLEGFINETETERNINQSGVQALFNDKAAFPSLQRLRIDMLANVKMIFDKELVADSFCKLEDMEVENCDRLSTIFPSTMVKVFCCLEKFRVRSCNSVEQIFEIGGLNMEETLGVECSQLRKLEIDNLPALKHVWSNDPVGFLTFPNLCSVRAVGCRNLRYLFPVSIAKDLAMLEHLKISSCGLEEIVWAGGKLEQPIRFAFPQLSSLEVTYLNELKCFYPGQHTIVWRMLENLNIGCPTLLKILASECLVSQEMKGDGQRDSIIRQQLFLAEEFSADLFHPIKVLKVSGGSTCVPISFFQGFYNLEILRISEFDFKDVVCCEGDFAANSDAGTTPSRIRELSLSRCKNLTHIQKKDPELGHILPYLETLDVWNCDDVINLGSSSSFQNLTTLRVERCEKMINLVTPSVAHSMVHLKEMKISDCSMMKEIVANSEGDEATYEITFSKLKDLELCYLFNLESFCAGNHTLKFPSLENLTVIWCPRLKVFCEGVLSTPKLQRAKLLSHYDAREELWDGDLNLCIQSMYTKKVGYGILDSLTLSDTFSDVMEIWNTNPLEVLDFKRLEKLEVCNCSSLKYIFTPSMALSLSSLEFLMVKECNNMEVVVLSEQGVEEEATTDKFFTFPSLWLIKIESCSNFACFHLGSGALQFPQLEIIDIADCPKMTTFASLYSRDEDKETIGDQGDLNIIASSFFSDNKVVAPFLMKLRIEGCHNLKYLFSSFMVKHFPQLRELSISGCKMMEEVIFFMEGLIEEERMNEIMFPELEFLFLGDLPKLTRFCYEAHNEFLKLTELDLRNCPLLKTFISKSETEYAEDVGDDSETDEIIEGNILEVENSALFNEKVVFPSLEWLTIEGMRDCRKIWQDQLSVNSFCKLKNICVESCEKLLSIFPFNMMERLEELNQLQIMDCDSLEEIIDSQGVIATRSLMPETKAKFVFPKVTYLQFFKLPKLKSFCSRINAIEWPSLKEMKVIECDKAEIFASERPYLGEIQTESSVEISNQKPLFWVNESTFPILEELELEPNHTLKGTSHGQLSTDCFRKLKVLELIRVLGKSAALLYCFIRSFPNIETLVLKDASVCQILQSEGLNDEERHASVLTRLHELRLSKLPDLTHLWNEEFQAVFYNLRVLKVEECGKLKTIVPSLAAFGNLTTLEVSRCHGLFNLIACSAAESLKQLEIMSITDCELIEEIIACDGEEVKGGIVFTKLMYLRLSCLPSLASFSLGDHIFEFPALRKVIVKECPKMKIFCERDLSAPKLKRMQVTGDEDDETRWRWDGNLNTTIQEIFKEMNVQNSGVSEINLQQPNLEEQGSM